MLTNTCAYHSLHHNRPAKNQVLLATGYHFETLYAVGISYYSFFRLLSPRSQNLHDLNKVCMLLGLKLTTENQIWCSQY